MESVTFANILDSTGLSNTTQVGLTITQADARDVPLGSASVSSEFVASQNDWRGSSYAFFFAQAVELTEGELYYLELDIEVGDSSLMLNGSPEINIITVDGLTLSQPLPRIMQSARAARITIWKSA